MADPRPPAAAQEGEAFACAGFHGRVVAAWRPPELEPEVRRLVDPAAAVETVHWGRNYLYRADLETAAGRIPVVVKQFRNQGWRARLLRRWRGSKAQRSFRAGGRLPRRRPADRRPGDADRVRPPRRAVVLRQPPPRRRRRGALSLPRRQPGTRARGVSANRLRRLPGHPRENPAADARPRLLPPRSVDRQRPGRRPGLPGGGGALHRRPQPRPSPPAPGLEPADPGPLPAGALPRRAPGAVPRRLLGRSAGGPPASALRALPPRIPGAHRGQEDPAAVDRPVPRLVPPAARPRPHPRGAGRRFGARQDRLGPPLRPTPPAREEAREARRPPRRRPQLHPPDGGLLRRRAAHLAALPAAAGELHGEPDGEPRNIPWDGVGICLRPLPQAPAALLAAVDELGVGKVLLRLHPWDDDHDAEEELARELRGRDCEIAFSLPQNRDLVRDPERWRLQIEELAERFTPYGRHFQVGQAINRSKWGVWRVDEYLALAATAAEILGRYPGVEILGPAVIDFEPHFTAALVNLPALGLRFDALASLLYVDRRGAPENTQLGFDAAGKAVLLRAIAETARHCGPRSWITEVNWPLWEGPHSPAGRGVAVDVDTQADYLARFFLLTLATGAVERVYWWQLVARGYGLIEPREVGGGVELRRRPAFHALRTLARELAGSRFLRPLESPAGTFLYLFRSAAGERVAGWSERGRQRATLPRPPRSAVGRDGVPAPVSATAEVELSPSVRYFRLDSKTGA